MSEVEARFHEGRDARPRAVLLAALICLGIIVAMSGAVAVLLTWIAPQTKLVQPPDFGAGDEASAAMGSAAMALEGYAWLDRDRGVVRIPIDAAMSLLAQRGWPEAGKAEPGP